MISYFENTETGRIRTAEVLFATSGSSGIGNFTKKLKTSVSDTEVIKDGKRLAANTSFSELKKWVKSIGSM